MHLAVIDIIFIVLISILAIRGYLRGLITEIMSMAAIVLGMLAALCFYRNGGEFVRNRFMPDLKTIPEIIAFVVLFLIVFLVIKILERILKDIVEGIRLGGADRILGLLFGFAEGMIVVSLVLFLLRIQPLFKPEPVLSDSYFASVLLPLITGTGGIGGV
jgi:membrane protein required for colicin V production